MCTAQGHPDHTPSCPHPFSLLCLGCSSRCLGERWACLIHWAVYPGTDNQRPKAAAYASKLRASSSSLVACVKPRHGLNLCPTGQHLNSHLAGGTSQQLPAFPRRRDEAQSLWRLSLLGMLPGLGEDVLHILQHIQSCDVQGGLNPPARALLLGLKTS